MERWARVSSIFRRLSFLIMPKQQPIHPGEILLEEFLKPLGLSQYRLAKDISVPPRRINEIVLGKRSISANTALRIGKYFQNTAQFWMNLQNHYDLELQKDVLGRVLKMEVKVYVSKSLISA
jgi:addiction module HigA family antidote